MRKVMANPPVRERRTETLSDADHVLSKAVVRAADILGLKNFTLARILGLSASSASRLKNGQFFLTQGTKPFELGQLLLRLFRSLDSISGGDDQTSRSWLFSNNLALRAKPIDLIQTISGLTNTVAYVDSRRARI